MTTQRAKTSAWEVHPHQLNLIQMLDVNKASILSIKGPKFENIVPSHFLLDTCSKINSVATKHPKCN